MGIGEITKQFAQQAIGDVIAGPETPTAASATPLLLLKDLAQQSLVNSTPCKRD
jgi:hypothetical protein